MQPVFIAGVSLGALLLIVAVVDFLLGKKISSSISMLVKKVPLVGKIASPFVILIAMVAFGFLLGGVSAIGGMLGTASVISGTQADVQASTQKCVVDYAQVSTIVNSLGSGNAANYSYVVDTANKKNYYIDSGNKTGDIANATAEINGTLTVYLTPSSIPTTGSECNALIYAVGPSYRSEDETGSDANNVWDLFDSARSVSLLNGLQYGNRVSPLRFQQDIFLSNAVAVTTSSAKERVNIQFTAGEAQDTLGFLLDFDATGMGHQIRNSVPKTIEFHQQLGNEPSITDPVIASFTLRKGSLDSL